MDKIVKLFTLYFSLESDTRAGECLEIIFFCFFGVGYHYMFVNSTLIIL